MQLGKVRERLSEKGLALELTEGAKEFVIDKGSEGDNTDYGARPLRRSVERFIEDPLSEELLRGAFEGQNTILVDVAEVGDEKRLEFTGRLEEGEGELAAVGASDEPSEPQGDGE